MKVQVGTYAGFCFGVDRAVQLVEEAAKAGGTVVTLGPIIHNRHVVDRFARMGVEVVEDPSAVPAGSTVILRAHGVPRQVEEALAGNRSGWWTPPAPLSSGFTGWCRRRRRKGESP